MFSAKLYLFFPPKSRMGAYIPERILIVREVIKWTIMSSGATLLNGFMLPKLGTAGWAWVEVALPYNLAVQVCSAPKGSCFWPF